MTAKTNSKKSAPALNPNTALVTRDANGDYIIRIGGNPDGTETKSGKGNTSYANTTGWGAKVVIMDSDGNHRPATLRCNLTDN